MINRFEDLEVWQLSRKLVNKIYNITFNNKFNKDYGLSNQIQRASVSVMSNIAEGFERKSNKEFIRFLTISKASCGEVRSQLYVALDLKYIDNEEFNKLSKFAEKILKSLAGFIKYLEGGDRIRRLED